jgi:hypothetical protein
MPPSRIALVYLALGETAHMAVGNLCRSAARVAPLSSGGGSWVFAVLLGEFELLVDGAGDATLDRGAS